MIRLSVRLSHSLGGCTLYLHQITIGREARTTSATRYLVLRICGDWSCRSTEECSCQLLRLSLTTCHWQTVSSAVGLPGDVCACVCVCVCICVRACVCVDVDVRSVRVLGVLQRLALTYCVVASAELCCPSPSDEHNVCTVHASVCTQFTIDCSLSLSLSLSLYHYLLLMSCGWYSNLTWRLILCKRMFTDNSSRMFTGRIDAVLVNQTTVINS